MKSTVFDLKFPAHAPERDPGAEADLSACPGSLNFLRILTSGRR